MLCWRLSSQPTASTQHASREGAGDPSLLALLDSLASAPPLSLDLFLLLQTNEASSEGQGDTQTVGRRVSDVCALFRAEYQHPCSCDSSPSLVPALRVSFPLSSH